MSLTNDTKFLPPSGDRMLTPGSIWKHFKGTTATIITVCKHSETGEDLVVYRCSGNEGRTNHTDGIYARPKAMFLSEVDHEKYPGVTQKYRLEKIREGCLPVELCKTNDETVDKEG